MPNTITSNIDQILKELEPTNVKLVAVTKTKPIADLMEAYQANFKRFGENKVQEMAAKYLALPKDIEWHMLGHLQTNKVKYIAPFVSYIHSVDSYKLLEEINKQAAKHHRIINCFLQIYIAREETKFGLTEAEGETIINSEQFKNLHNIKIAGLMGMASNTPDFEVIRQEFKSLKYFFEKLKLKYVGHNINLKELSMGMSSDYKLAIHEGSTMVRIGSAIFGNR